MTFKEAQKAIRKYGVTLSQKDGRFTIRNLKGSQATTVRTLEEAIKEAKYLRI